MVISRYAISCSFALAVVLAAVSPSVGIDSASDAVAQIAVVPRHNQWSLIDPDQRQALRSIVKTPAADRDRLARLGDARERAIGIFIAEQQGDLDLLLSIAHLLDDGEPTIPYALPTAMPEEYATRAQTVAEYLSSVYLEWFGVDVDRSTEKFAELFGDVTDSSRLVRPWIVRLRRARDDSQATAQIKELVTQLPEEVRWAVVTLGYYNGFYTEPEARTILSRLSAPIKNAIQGEERLLPEEPLFRMNRGTYRTLALERCQRLLSPSSDK
jgi:hypothetical protein